MSVQEGMEEDISEKDNFLLKEQRGRMWLKLSGSKKRTF